MRVDVAHDVDISLRYLQQVGTKVDILLEAGGFVERWCFDGVGWEGAVGFRFDEGARGQVPEVNEVGVKR